MTSTRKESALPQRRGFLKQIAAVAGGLPFSSGLVSGSVVGASLDAVAARAAPQDPQTTDPVVGYISFSQDEAAFVEAMVTTMCPADEFTPNGVDSVSRSTSTARSLAILAKAPSAICAAPGRPANRNRATSCR